MALSFDYDLFTSLIYYGNIFTCTDKFGHIVIQDELAWMILQIYANDLLPVVMTLWIMTYWGRG